MCLSSKRSRFKTVISFQNTLKYFANNGSIFDKISCLELESTKVEDRPVICRQIQRQFDQFVDKFNKIMEIVKDKYDEFKTFFFVQKI